MERPPGQGRPFCFSDWITTTMGTVFYQCAIHEILATFPKDGVRFEWLTKALFEAQGFRAQTTPRSGDRGIDLYMEKDGLRYIVQCKMYQPGNNVGGPEVQNLLGALARHTDVSHAFFVTTSDYTSQAREIAEGQRITLINGDMLQRWIYQHLPLSPTATPLPPRVSHFSPMPITQKHRWPWTRMVIIFGLLAICTLVWGVLWALVSSSPEQQQIRISPSVIPATSTLISVLTTTPTLAPIPTATSTPLPGPGQAVPIGDFAFTVQEVITMTQIDKYQAQGVFLVVSLWAENITSETRGVGPMDASFRVSDERGRTWEEHQASTPICWQRGHTYIGSAYWVVATDRKIGPGFGFETTAAFDVPADARGFRMTIIDHSSRKQGTIGLGR